MENYNTHTRPSPHASLLRVTTRCCSCSLFRGMVPFFSTRSTLWHPPMTASPRTATPPPYGNRDLRPRPQTTGFHTSYFGKLQPPTLAT